MKGGIGDDASLGSENYYWAVMGWIAKLLMFFRDMWRGYDEELR